MLSIGLVASSSTPNTVTDGGKQSHQTFSDIITLRQVTHSSKNSSSTTPHLELLFNPRVVTPESHHRVRRFSSIWRNPLTARLRNKLAPIRRSFVVTSRESSPQNNYHRMSQFVRNRLHNLGVSLNNKLRYKGRSIKEESLQQQQNLTVVASNVTLTNSTNSTDVFFNQTESNLIDRFIRRNDDSWPNRIDNDMPLNVSLKSSEDNAPYLSPTLNVIDLEPDKTKIAHNILVVRKSGKPASEHYTDADNSHDLLPTKLQTPAPVLVLSEIKSFGPNRETTIMTVQTTTSTTARPSLVDSDLEFVPFKNNHRPSVFMSLAKWKLKNKDKLITSTTAKMENSTPLPSSTVPKDQQVASTHLLIANSSSPVTKPSITKSTATESTIQWQSSFKSSMQPSTSTEFHTPSTKWSSTVASATRSKPTVRTTITSQSESVADLTTREQWSTVSALSQDDFWSSWSATENPMTTVFTSGNVTEFDLPVTRPSTDANESTQSWKTHNGDGVQSTNGWKDTAWSELITKRPLNATSTGDRSATTNTSTVSTGTLEDDDNSIELLKEYQYRQTNTPTTTHSTIIADKGTEKANFYLNNAHSQHHQHKQPQHSMNDAVVIFKNNHGRPRPRPISTSTSRPLSTTSKFITAKPPYVTDFFYPTTISVKKPAITAANIVAHRLKQPDEVQSASLTVLDPPFVPNSFMKLPLNTTIVHKNILVPMKEGRPKPSYPLRPTTQFPPVYPVVAGVSNWQIQTTPWILPSMTTSSPDILPVRNFTSEDFKMYTTSTPAPTPTKTIIKIISVRPIQSGSSSIDRVSIVHPSTSTTTAAPVATSSTSHRPPSYPVATAAGYVNAIYAPPMPVLMPSHSIDSSNQAGSVWVRPFRRLVNMIAPNQSSVGFMSLVRSVLYSLMVLILPPLALMSVFI